MNLSKYLPLTETTFYILLALIEPGHGYYIMQKVEDLSSGKVRIAAGTMYGAIDNLLKSKLISLSPSEDKRRKTYIITQLGTEVLQSECDRLRYMVSVAEKNNL